MSVVISISIPEEVNAFLSTMDNKSEYIVNAIQNQRGKSELSLNELEAKRTQQQAELDETDSKIACFIETQLQHKDELRQKEIEEYERKKAEQEQKEMEFKNRMETLVGNEPEIQNFKFFEGWESTSNLIGLIELFRARNIRIGIFELRKYLASKPITE